MCHHESTLAPAAPEARAVDEAPHYVQYRLRRLCDTLEGLADAPWLQKHETWMFQARLDAYRLFLSTLDFYARVTGVLEEEPDAADA
jgi:hypothetical protein